jgi:hypothetical protein
MCEAPTRRWREFILLQAQNWVGQRRPAPLSRRQILGHIAALVVGVVLWSLLLRPAQFTDIQRYTYGYRSGDPSGLTSALVAEIHRALVADIGLILGYALILGTCASIASRLAVSRLGQRFGQWTRCAVVIVVTADLLEDLGLYLGTLQHSSPLTGFNGFLTTATAAMAVIKTCALIVAFLAVPAAAVVLFLRAFSCWQLKPSRQGPNWWNDCWEDPAIPAIEPAPLKIDEWSWVNSYNVPGATDIIERRNGRPVQAICLSGGGVRSACVAMGALQEFSNAKPVTVTHDASALGDGHRTEAATPAQTVGETPSSSGRADDEQTGTPKLIDSVDYIISVSGGGYTAGARLLACQDRPEARVLSGDKPAGTPDSEHDQDRKLRLSERFEEGSVEFEHMRRHSSYIADSVPTMMRALFEVFKNLVASVVTLFWLPVVIGFVSGYLLASLPIAAFVPVPRYTEDGKQQISEDTVKSTADYFPSLVHNAAAWWAAGVFIAIAIVFTAGALFTEWVDHGVISEKKRLRRLKVAQTASMFAGLVLLLTVALPAVMRACASVSVTHYSHLGGTVGALLGLQYLTAIVAMVWRHRDRIPVDQLGKTSWRDKLPRGVVPLVLVIVTLTVLALTWLIVLGSVAAGVFGYLTQSTGGPLRQVAWLLVWVTVLLALAFMLSTADVTSLSLHPFYRARLALAFAVRRIVRPVWSTVICQARAFAPDESTWLHSYGKVVDGPQFVFSAAAAISGDGKPAPGLNAVSYVLSDKYVGGPDLGWLKTEELWQACPSRIKRDLTVEAAVAISGAAFGSTMGRQNKGSQTLFAVSGARLGTWLPNPNYVALLGNRTDEQDQTPRSVTSEMKPSTDPLPQPAPEASTDAAAPPSWLMRSLPTVRGFTYFYRELFGRHPIDASLVQVTDGGHYENLGLVEALRRRCRLIFCIDGGGDTPPLLSGLSDAAWRRDRARKVG